MFEPSLNFSQQAVRVSPSWLNELQKTHAE
jgi:hypothetical protein